MKNMYKFIEQVPISGQDVPQDSILSQTLYENDRIKAILFRFAPDQELSEHTASVPAILHFLEGEARLVLGEDEKTAQPGTWVYMPAKQPHSISAKTNLSMLLYLLET